MHILHIKYPKSCIRMFKESKIMLERGHRVDAAASTHGFGHNIYSTVYSYADHDQLARIIEQSTADILHVHTEPDWIVSFVKEHSGGRPVVMDVHDPDSLRTCKKPTDDETAAFSAADAIIHVSEPCREYCEKVHGAKKPTLILYSYVNGEFYAASRGVNWYSMVYEGGLTSRLQNEEGLFYFRNYHLVTHKFIKAGYNVTLFGAGGSIVDNSYESMGALVCRDLPYTTMLSGIRNHAFGFVGSSVPVKLMHAAMPNKLFEYISQGVVPIVWNADTAGEFCQRNGVGIWLKSEEDLDDLPRVLSRGPALRRNLLKVRDQWKMETQAEALEKFYQSLLDNNQAYSFRLDSFQDTEKVEA